MNADEFDAYLAACTQALEDKQAQLVAAQGDFSSLSWKLDATLQTVSFSDAAGERLRFRITALGTYAAAQETWKWAWANTKLPTSARDSAAVLKGLQAVTDYACFIDDEAFAADEGMAWEMAAAGVAYLRADGCFRARNRDTWLFIALHRE